MFADTRFAVLGGQHISAAIRAVYVNMVEKKGYKPEDVPEAMKCVHAEVLRVDCPNTIASLAAGQHQRQQHDTMDVNTADILKMMVQRSRTMEGTKGHTLRPRCPAVRHFAINGCCQRVRNEESTEEHQKIA